MEIRVKKQLKLHTLSFVYQFLSIIGQDEDRVDDGNLASSVKSTPWTCRPCSVESNKLWPRIYIYMYTSFLLSAAPRPGWCSGLRLPQNVPEPLRECVASTVLVR